MSELRVSYLVGRADRMLRTAMEERLIEAGLAIAEVTALSVLSSRPGLSNARLARRSLVTPQAMHKVIRSLETAGLIERSHSSQGGRSLGAFITDQGRKVLAEIDSQMVEVEEAFLRPLSTTERRQVRTMLAKLGGVRGADGGETL